MLAPVTRDSQVQLTKKPGVILDERFIQSALDPRLRWLNPPPTWAVDPSRPALVVQPAARTDFWQQTHYGFRADSGHFLFAEISGDFTITTKVRYQPVDQYDQAGLMIRVDANCWIKTSVEYEPSGPAKLGAVVTNRGFSDWSVQDFPRAAREIGLRIRKAAQDFTLEFSAMESIDWRLLRLTHLPIANVAPLSCGLYACCPKGDGFRAEFEFLEIVRNVD